MMYLQIIIEIFTCAGVIIALFQLHYFYKSILLENERNRKQITLEMFKEHADRLYEIDVKMKNSGLKKNKNKPISYEDIINDEGKLLLVKEYLNLLEWIATGINTYIYDIHVFDRLFGDNLLRIDRFLFDYVPNSRIELERPDLFTDYELLVNKIRRMHALKDNRNMPNADAEIKYRFDKKVTE